jgi:uncharacterized protein
MVIASSVWSCSARGRAAMRVRIYDIAVFLEDLTDRWREFHRLADLRTEILAETGAFLEARPFQAGSYRDRTALMREIRRDGLDL